MDNTKSRNQIDMLHGPLLMKIIVFTLPLAASSILQQLFNSVDVAVVGRFASSQALAAVGSNTPVISLLINLFMGVSMGANVIISNHIGQNDKRSIRDAIGTVGITALVSGLFLMVLGISVARPILTLMNTPADVLDLAVTYLRIFFLGIPFFMIFDFGSAILRSMGDTRRPLYILMVAGIVNTILNLIFVIVFHMSVAGVAIATSIANAVSAALIIYLLIHEKGPFRLNIKRMRVKWKELRRMLQIGVPAGLQGMVFSFSNVVVQSAINGYGYGAIAGSAAALNFEFYSYFFIAAFNGAAITFIGQNYGAGKLDRVNRIFWICMALGALTCALCNWCFTWQDEFFLGLFTGDPHVLEYGKIRMHNVLVIQFIAASYEVAASAMRGMGKSIAPTLVTIFGTCVLRMVWVFAVLPHFNDFKLLMWVYPFSWAITGFMMLTLYRIHWKNVKKQNIN
ncbi:MATE family efflux transporter [Segatella copri]|uniref:MATE family efflux transporter n=1 Tax=Segatella sinensis TaxID=3085167 RepID=A0ABV1FWI5_9BACT